LPTTYKTVTPKAVAAYDPRKPSKTVPLMANRKLPNIEYGLELKADAYLQPVASTDIMAVAASAFVNGG